MYDLLLLGVLTHSSTVMYFVSVPVFIVMSAYSRKVFPLSQRPCRNSVCIVHDCAESALWPRNQHFEISFLRLFISCPGRVLGLNIKRSKISCQLPLSCMQSWEFTHSLIAHSLILLKSNEQLWAIFSDCSRQMSDCERMAQVAQRKWAICSGRSEEMSEWTICSKNFG